MERQPDPRDQRIKELLYQRNDVPVLDGRGESMFDLIGKFQAKLAAIARGGEDPFDRPLPSWPRAMLAIASDELADLVRMAHSCWGSWDRAEKLARKCEAKDDALRQYSSAQVRERDKEALFDNRPEFNWSLHKKDPGGWYHYTVPPNVKPWDAADKAIGEGEAAAKEIAALRELAAAVERTDILQWPAPSTQPQDMQTQVRLRRWDDVRRRLLDLRVARAAKAA